MLASMDDEKPPAHANIAYLPASGGLPPHPPSSISPLIVKREVSPRSPCGPDVSMPNPSPANSHFSQDISRMPDYPQKKPGHRRAHSEIVSLPDDIGYGHFSMYMDMEKLISSPVTSGSGLTAGESSSASPSPNDYDSGGSTSEKPRVRHRHSYSMDGSTSIKPEMPTSPEPTLVETKKAMSAAQLADLALVDPKRAKR